MSEMPSTASAPTALPRPGLLYRVASKTTFLLAVPAAIITVLALVFSPTPLVLFPLLLVSAVFTWRYSLQETALAHLLGFAAVFVFASQKLGAFSVIANPVSSAKNPVWFFVLAWLMLTLFGLWAKKTTSNAMTAALSETMRSVVKSEAESSQIVEIAELVVSSDTERVVLVVRADGSLVYASPGAEKAFEVSESDLLDTAFNDLFPSVDLRKLVTESEEGFSHPVEAVRRGERRVFVAVAYALSSPGLYLFSAKDVSVIESSLQDHITAAVSAQEAEIELTQAAQVKNDLVTVVSHELRTPVTSILGYAEIIEAKTYGDILPGYEQAAAVIIRNANRLLDLTEDLLDLQRIRNGQDPKADTVVDVAKVTQACVASVLPIAEARAVSLDVAVLQPTLAQGHADDVERIVLNLLSNAIKFTPEMGSVTVAISETETSEGTYSCIEVTDTGLGISQEDIDKLFTPFFRAAQAKTHAVQGTGLGLSIVRELVEGMSGKIKVQSSVGEGSVFTILLPTVSYQPDDRYRSKHLGSLHTTRTGLKPVTPHP